MPLAPANRARLQATFAAIITLCVAWRVGSPIAWTLCGGMTLLAVLSWLAPSLYAPVARGLEAAARVFVMVISWCALGLVYFGVFTPMRVWRALRRQDPLKLRRASKDVPTYLQVSPPPTAFDRQF